VVKTSRGSSPLFLHACGQWARKVKIGGKWKFRYFGTDKQKALEKWLSERDHLLAGRLPPKAGADYASVEYVCERFAQSKQTLLEAGRIGKIYALECRSYAQIVMDCLGPMVDAETLTPEDFDRLLLDFSRRWGPTRTRNAVKVTRQIFKHAVECGYLTRNARFGPNFKGPGKRELRVHRAKQGKRLFEPSQILGLVEIASPTIKAMTLLAINGGFQNKDCAELHWGAINWADSTLNLHRNKTGIARRCFLWPETIEALKALGPGKAEELVFRTKYGRKWDSTDLGHEFRKLLDAKGYHRAGINFSALRHTFQTIGEESRDSLAVKMVMGHADNTISDVYRERFPDERLKAVSDTVRGWLFGGSQE
jgi:integrase